MLEIEVPRLRHAPLAVQEAPIELTKHEPVLLRHHWPETARRPPAEVRVGHTGNALYVYARLLDDCVVCHATGPNQKMWQLGDTFEMFLKSDENPAYFELHVTPRNDRLCLGFGGEDQFRSDVNEETFESFLLSDSVFASEAVEEPGSWAVLARIPAELIEGEGGSLEGRRWRFSFCRYDYDVVPGEPVCSSTTNHAEFDFHRTAEWGVLHFE